jgi:hypothetical protein
VYKSEFAKPVSNTDEKLTFTIPEINQDTVRNFSLIVSDGIAFSEPSTIKVFVVNAIKTRSEILDKNGLNKPTE